MNVTMEDVADVVAVLVLIVVACCAVGFGVGLGWHIFKAVGGL